MLNEKTAQLKNFFEVFSPKHLECARCLFPARLDRLTYGPLAWSCTFFLQADHLGNRYLGLAGVIDDSLFVEVLLSMDELHCYGLMV